MAPQVPDRRFELGRVADLGPVDSDVRIDVAAVEQHHRARAIVKLTCPDLEVAPLRDAAPLPPQRVLVHRDHLVVR